MAEAAGLFIFVVLAVTVGSAIVSHIVPALGALLAVGLALAMVAGVLYVGGVVLQLPMGPLSHTRLGRALSSSQARENRTLVTLAYWGVLVALVIGLLALGHFAVPR
jgi:hypothetical protein